MHRRGPFDQASDVHLEEGQVLIDGPDGVAFALTPAAARELGRRLIAVADEKEAGGGEPEV